jgi:fructose-specific phosphotransferase system component IIB
MRFVEFTATKHNLEVKIETRDSITVRGAIAARENEAAKIIGPFIPIRNK